MTKISRLQENKLKILMISTEIKNFFGSIQIFPKYSAFKLEKSLQMDYSYELNSECWSSGCSLGCQLYVWRLKGRFVGMLWLSWWWDAQAGWCHMSGMCWMQQAAYFRGLCRPSHAAVTGSGLKQEVRQDLQLQTFYLFYFKHRWNILKSSKW